MNILVNGKPETIDGEITVKSLLDKKGINSNVVACELNLKILKRAHLAEIKIKEGDTLEIIQMVGGG